MKRHQVILIVFGTLVAVACLGVGWLLFTALSAKSEAADARNQAYSEVRQIYGSKVFPNEANIARVKEDEKALNAWLESASNVVHKGDLTIGHESPTGFKKLLLDTVRSLANQPGAVNGKVVASGFNFGFDRYLGDSATLPEKDQVDRLARQLSIIETICKELYASKIVSLDAVVRETFEEKDSAEKVQSERPAAKPKKRRPRDEASGRGAKAAAATHSEGRGGSELFSKQRFTFQFKARPDALIETMNRLAAMDLFVVVAEAEVHKDDDMLTKPSNSPSKDSGSKKSGGIPGGAAVDPSTVPHAQRIVTDPGLDAPVSVKLDIDVYSFEGV